MVGEMKEKVRSKPEPDKRIKGKKGRAKSMVPLGLLSVGEKAEVLGIREGHGRNGFGPDGPAADRDYLGRIEEMGLRIGKTVEMLNSNGGSALLIRIDESRIAIGRGMAMKIMVKRN